MLLTFLYRSHLPSRLLERFNCCSSFGLRMLIITKTSNDHLRSFQSNCSLTDLGIIKLVTYAIICFRLNCAESGFHSISESNILQLQHCIIKAACIVLQPNFTNNTAALTYLHSLPIDLCIQFKIATLTPKVLYRNVN